MAGNWSSFYSTLNEIFKEQHLVWGMGLRKKMFLFCRIYCGVATRNYSKKLAPQMLGCSQLGYLLTASLEIAEI
jgi:hypothetical protein